MTKTKWLTIKEATLHCYERGLPRSSKSLRRWCSKSEIEAQKRQAGTGEKWFIDRASLDIKIQEELEFLKHTDTSLPFPTLVSGQRQDASPHEHSQVDISAHCPLCF